MSAPKILAFSGSTRRASFNKKLVAFTAELARQAGSEVTLIDLKDYPMPLYDEDNEAAHGLPENAKKLKALAKSHDAFLIASPEYNSSYAPLLKNTIDWISRPEPGDANLAAFVGKVAALLSASPGKLGGLRGLVHVRSFLENIGVIVIPEQVAVPNAAQVLGDVVRLEDATVKALEKLCARLVDVVTRLRYNI